MHSTDHHINNPTVVDQISIGKEINLEKHYQHQYVTQEYYNRIAEPDPYTVYIITDSGNGRLYLGRNLIEPNRLKYRYFIAPNPEMKEEWDVIKIDENGMTTLYTADLAMAARLVRDMYNQGTDGILQNKLYSAVEGYVRYSVSLNQAIIGCLVAFGIDPNNSELQNLMSWLVLKEDRKHNQRMERDLSWMAEQNPGSIASLYQWIFNWFFVNDFFVSMKKLSDDEVLPIGDQLQDLQRIYADWRLIG
ncbi:MAG: hypothetical protein HDQ88_02680 [Clostridia bacterium]|nr:hypothetical protein [Clostridia bacterium]